MSKPLHTWKIAVTIPLSVLNATPSIPALVWVYQAIQMYVPTHTFLCEIFDYLSIEVLLRHAI